MMGDRVNYCMFLDNYILTEMEVCAVIIFYLCD